MYAFNKTIKKLVINEFLQQSQSTNSLLLRNQNFLQTENTPTSDLFIRTNMVVKLGNTFSDIAEYDLKLHPTIRNSQSYGYTTKDCEIYYMLAPCRL